MEPVLRGRANSANEDTSKEDAELSAKQQSAKKRRLLDQYSTKKSVARVRIIFSFAVILEA